MTSLIHPTAGVSEEAEIGDNCKIQDGCPVYQGVARKDGVFPGPGVILTKGKIPRATPPHGDIKTGAAWETSAILVKRRASLGAGTSVLAGVTIGEFALVGAGVTKTVPPYGPVTGVPDRLVGRVDEAGHVIERADRP